MDIHGLWTQLSNGTLLLPAGAAGPRLFTIHQIDANTNNLPKAHTWWMSHIYLWTQQQRIDSSEYAFHSRICLVSAALIGSTFHPMRVMTSCTTSCWRRLRRLVALRWNETHWGAFELPAVFLFSHLYSSLYCSISCCYLHFCNHFFICFLEEKVKIKDMSEQSLHSEKQGAQSSHFQSGNEAGFGLTFNSFYFLFLFFFLINLTCNWTGLVLLNLEHCR